MQASVKNAKRKSRAAMDLEDLATVSSPRAVSKKLKITPRAPHLDPFLPNPRRDEYVTSTQGQ